MLHTTLPSISNHHRALQGKQQVAKRDVPTLASQRTAEDNLWLALAGLTLAGRIHLLVSTHEQLLLSLMMVCDMSCTYCMSQQMSNSEAVCS